MTKSKIRLNNNSANVEIWTALSKCNLHCNKTETLFDTDIQVFYDFLI